MMSGRIKNFLSDTYFVNSKCIFIPLSGCNSSTVCSKLTDNIQVDSLAAGGVVPPGDLTLVLPGVGHRHASDHQDKLGPVLAHHRLNPAVPGVAQVVQSHQLRYWSGVAQPGNLQDNITGLSLVEHL